MKTIIILSIVLLHLKGFSQKNFLNQTPKQVEDYWLAQPGGKGNIQKTNDENGKVGELFVMVEKVGNPIFIAYFEKGKCFKFCSTTSDSNVYDIKENWKKNGYTYDTETDKWSNKIKKMVWTCSDIFGEKYQMCCEKL